MHSPMSDVRTSASTFSSHDSAMAAWPTQSRDGTGRGWLLSLPGKRIVAVGERELVHILPEVPMLRPIPRAPRHARRAMVWQQRILPVIDLAELFDEGTEDSAVVPLIGVVAFSASGRKATGLGALLLYGVPQRLETSMNEPREMPPRLQALADWSLSCLEHPEHGEVPILYLSKLFSRVPVPVAEVA